MSVSRRQLFAGAAALIATSAVASIHGSAAASGFALVRPSSTWLLSTAGAPGAGVTVGSWPSGWADVNGAASDPARTTAKPVLQWATKHQIRSTGPETVAVFADAKGGIAKVTFHVEGTNQDVTSVVPWVDEFGNIKPVYAINVDVLAAVAAHGSGAVRVYAAAYANDGTMQQRVIGPTIVYPRATMYDWDKTCSLGGVGADYTDLQSAMRAMRLALTPAGSGGGGFECGRATLVENGTYNWGCPANWGAPWSYGFSRVCAANGVTATISRFNNSGVNAFDPADFGSANTLPNNVWIMFGYVNNLEFYGPGLNIDRVNINQIRSENSTVNVYNLHPLTGSTIGMTCGHFAFSGCNIINSQTWPQTYWNGVYAGRITIGELNGGVVICHADNATLNRALSAQMFDTATGAYGSKSLYCKVQDGIGAGHDGGANCVFGEYLTNWPLSREDYYNGGTGPSAGSHNSATTQYVGAATGATVNWSDASRILTFTTTGGASPYTVTFQTVDPQLTPADLTASPPKVAAWADIKSWLDTNKPGDWTWTIQSDPFCPYWLFQAYQANNSLWPIACKAAPLTFLTGNGIHAEAVMWNAGPFQNVFYQNVTYRNCGFGTSYINFSALGSNFKDVSIKNVTMDPGTSTFNDNGTNPTGNHLVIENLSLYSTMQVRNGVGELDAYCSMKGVIAKDISSLSGTWSGADLTPVNCVAVMGSAPTGAPYNNVNMGISGPSAILSAWNALFVNEAAGDYTPAGGQPPASNLFTTVNPKDAQLATRAASDAPGAWKIGGTAPSWPF